MICIGGSSCGLSYTPREHIECGCEAFTESGTLLGRELHELLGWLSGGSFLASSVGLAAANAVLKPSKVCMEGDLLDSLDLRPGEKVMTVGRFKPMEAAIASRGARLGFVEWGDSAEPLRRCDVALITATTIINKTLEDLLDEVERAREVVILGPSTPYAPRIFQDTPVTMLAGSVVNDGARVRRVVCEGGGTRTMGKALSKWVARI